MDILENIDIDKENLENIDIDVDTMISENIDINKDIDKVKNPFFFKNIDSKIWKISISILIRTI